MLPGTTPSLSGKWRRRKYTRANRCFIFAENIGAWRATPKELFFVEDSLSQGIVFLAENSLPLGIAGRPRRFGRIAHLFAMALHFAQRVDRLVLRFIVSARNDFAEQSHGEELHAADEPRQHQHHPRPALR